MMEITLTCKECHSAIPIYPASEVSMAQCPICTHQMKMNFTSDHERSQLTQCPCCERKDFYAQKDFNRKIGVLLFILAAVISPWTYGISFVVLYLFDLFLFKKLRKIAICYKCQSIFRKVSNIDEIPDFNHEMNDRIVYSDHDFKGRPLEH